MPVSDSWGVDVAFAGGRTSTLGPKRDSAPALIDSNDTRPIATTMVSPATLVQRGRSLRPRRMPLFEPSRTTLLDGCGLRRSGDPRECRHRAMDLRSRSLRLVAQSLQLIKLPCPESREHGLLQVLRGVEDAGGRD